MTKRQIPIEFTLNRKIVLLSMMLSMVAMAISLFLLAMSTGQGNVVEEESLVVSGAIDTQSPDFVF